MGVASLARRPGRATTTDRTSVMAFAHRALPAQAQVWRYAATDTSLIVHLTDQTVAGNGFTATYPANSITLFVLPAPRQVRLWATQGDGSSRRIAVSVDPAHTVPVEDADGSWAAAGLGRSIDYRFALVEPPAGRG